MYVSHQVEALNKKVEIIFKKTPNRNSGVENTITMKNKITMKK